MTKPEKPDDTDESALFRAAMRGVKPLTHTKMTPEKSRQPFKRRINVAESEDNRFVFSDYDRLEPVKSEDFLTFSRSGLQHKVLRQFRQGQYPTQAILDLHGKTVIEARESLAEFLLQCQQNGLRHALIIHGKGRHSDAPILKNKLNNWLRQTEQVLAFCTAQPKHGGHGALYVLLRR